LVPYNKKKKKTNQATAFAPATTEVAKGGKKEKQQALLVTVGDKGQGEKTEFAVESPERKKRVFPIRGHIREGRSSMKKRKRRGRKKRGEATKRGG